MIKFRNINKNENIQGNSGDEKNKEKIAYHFNNILKYFIENKFLIFFLP